MMKRLCEMKNCLISAAQSQMSNLQNCDAEELGEVIDMIKDIEQAIYYCTITKAMKEKSDDEEPQRMYYKESIRKKNVMYLWTIMIDTKMKTKENIQLKYTIAVKVKALSADVCIWNPKNFIMIKLKIKRT